MTRDLSILIPTRNEEWVRKTIADIIEHIEADTEILVGIDGSDDVEIAEENNDRVRKHFTGKVLGQRAMTNELARLSDAKYVMKTDGHCSFSQGFDAAMMRQMDEKTILAPQMGVLTPQSWAINGKKMTTRYCFDTNFVMQYDQENGNEETMCLQGSCWMISRENYWKWNVCDEMLGSWGGQAAELGIAAWLHDARCRTTRDAYYGHVFRHSDKDFPYERGESPGKFATEELKRRYGNDPRIKEMVNYFGFPADWKSMN